VRNLLACQQEEELDMVKLQFSIIKKRYKNGRRVYHYERVSLDFPREFHELMKTLRNRRLKMDVTQQGKTTNITLTECEDS